MEPKRLAQYARTCRKLGITKLTIGDVSFELALDHEPPRRAAVKLAPSPTSDKIEVEELSDEELLFWSATGTNI